MLRIKEDNGEVDAEEVGSLIAQAYPERIARALDNIGNFRMANGNTVFIDKSDAMSAQEWIAIASLNSASCNEPLFQTLLLLGSFSYGENRCR